MKRSQAVLIVLKTKDICSALTIKRHHLRMWTDTLQPYCSQNTQERSARKFDTGDLMYFATIKHIEDKFGIPVSKLSDISKSIYDTIRSPRIMSSQELIYLNFESNKCLFADSLEKKAEGLLIDTTCVKNLVCEFLGLIPKQSELHLGLTRVS
ncbi:MULTISPECIES: hypothetical protein [unclassified Pseudoalteromonas]|uniref:hypothetical protein n=1 Tax=unclassified Pseudoalteromonas TaxID=194690 RepID=UPI0011095E18|nr:MULTISPECIES: hypothetical protein [unclassified Pseudoalteromonas]TMO41923.1 hypothetical protein CWC25_18120 [Pseudoalteromonas sp. S4389]